MKVSFIGLGVMGFPMAGHLQSNGFDVCVYNRTTSKVESWQSQYGGRIATTPCAAAEGADLKFTAICHYIDCLDADTSQDINTASMNQSLERAVHLSGVQQAF